ncbi:MAG: glycoside hydrolase family 88 protein [Acidobacteria bacterium]|nr:glycoside hydrolase family 88 protein [Acidobacteriota bacterium]
MGKRNLTMKINSDLEVSGLRAALEQAFDFGLRQLAGMMKQWPCDKAAPIYTDNGVWTRPAYMWTDWCPGFYAGMMWLACERTGEPFWRQAAEQYTRALEGRKFDREVHDLGFIFMSTADRWYRLLGDDDPTRQGLKDLLITAGTIQSFRWKASGEDHYIYSFHGPQSLFIDIMMNIRLLFRAHQLGASRELYDKATTHARTTEKYLVQKSGARLMDTDGAVIHEAIFNPERGEFRNLSTQQGYSPFTCWARGLAWAMYGFTDTYLFTGERFFLETAERCAAYYLTNTPDDGVPFWDYGAPAIPREPLDSSAAAIVAGALWKLQGIAETRGDAKTYRQAALTILATLTSDEFTGAKAAAYEGILRHGVYHRPMNWGVDESVMWGDYFFMEALHMVLSEVTVERSGSAN